MPRRYYHEHDRIRQSCAPFLVVSTAKTHRPIPIRPPPCTSPSPGFPMEGKTLLIGPLADIGEDIFNASLSGFEPSNAKAQGAIFGVNFRGTGFVDASSPGSSATKPDAEPMRPLPRRLSRSYIKRLKREEKEIDLARDLERQKRDQNQGWIFEEYQIPPPRLPVQDINNAHYCLERLISMFPDVQIEVFQELLDSYQGEPSRMAVVADLLIRWPQAAVRGRTREPDDPRRIQFPRIPQEDRQLYLLDGRDHRGDEGLDEFFDALEVQQPSQDADPRLMQLGYHERAEQRRAPPGATFLRTPAYLHAARRLAQSEFPDLSKGEIMSVLSQHKGKYLSARTALSFRSMTFLNGEPIYETMFSAEYDPSMDPLLHYRFRDPDTKLKFPEKEPCIKSTGNRELDLELFNNIVQPLLEQERRINISVAKAMRDLALDFAEKRGSAIDCNCCYMSKQAHELVKCSDHDHLLCVDCVERSVSEAVFGQTFRITMVPETGALKCIAMDAEKDGCTGTVSAVTLKKTVWGTTNGPGLLRRLDQRMAEHSLLAANLPLVRCPFCEYAEIDEMYLPSTESVYQVRLRQAVDLPSIMFCVMCTPLAFVTGLVLFWVNFLYYPMAVILLWLMARDRRHLAPSAEPYSLSPWTEWQRAVYRHHCRVRGVRFQCRHPRCSRTSCLKCGVPWADSHVCRDHWRSSLDMYLNDALSNRMKRVCPRCKTACILDGGCNKLTCPCGHVMCYVCRADISVTGYRHFCNCLREPGDGSECTRCRLCNLWQANDEGALAELQADAEREWIQLNRPVRKYTPEERRRASDLRVVSGVSWYEIEHPLAIMVAGYVPRMDEVMNFLVLHLVAT